MTPATAAIGCIVLAAGASARFGADKRLAPFGANTLLTQTLHNIAPAFSQRVLVLRAGDTTLAALYAADWQVVFAAEAHKGMGHSLAAALRFTTGWTGAVIALGDMPLVQTATYGVVRAQLSPDNLVVPYHHGQRGNPVGIGSRYFAELSGLQGDRGARALLEQHQAQIVRVAVDDSGILQDIDTREALAEAEKSAEGSGISNA